MTANPEIVDMIVKWVNTAMVDVTRHSDHSLRSTSEALVRRPKSLPLAHHNHARAALGAALYAASSLTTHSPTFETILAAAAQLADHWYEEAKAQLEDPSPEVLTKGETV